ncbi:MAG: DnaJ domain-containing protein [Acidimicrobiales bacterium]
MAAQREWLDNDYYAALGVSSKATAKEVTKAYRALAQKWHPDAQGGDEDRFKKVSAAYDVVGDESKRKEYDQLRSMGPMAGGFAGGPRGGQGSYEMRMEDFADMGGIEDILSGLFGNRGGRQQRGSYAMPGADVETQIHLQFEDALVGATSSVPVKGTGGPRSTP